MPPFLMFNLLYMRYIHYFLCSTLLVFLAEVDDEATHLPPL